MLFCFEVYAAGHYDNGRIVSDPVIVSSRAERRHVNDHGMFVME